MADDVIKYFPQHDLFIELFFGGGGIFFNKPKAIFNILNDLDSDVFNLFQVLRNQPNDLRLGVFNMPVHSDLFQYWRFNKETDSVMKAVRFLFLSNFGFMGKPETMLLGANNTKRIILENIDSTHLKISDCQFMNFDFREALQKIGFRDPADKDKAFIYADPPYLNTTNNYSDSFNEIDCIDLFDTLQSSGIRFAISEEDNPFVLAQAEQRGLNIIKVLERQSLKKRSTEILITNYEIKVSLFD